MDILGQHGVVKFTDKYGLTTRWWADKGSLHWEDSNGKHGTIVNLHDAAVRLLSVRAVIGKQTDKGAAIDEKERKAMVKFDQEFEALIRKAVQQGNAYYKMQDHGKISESDWNKAGLPKYMVPQRFHIDVV